MPRNKHWIIYYGLRDGVTAEDKITFTGTREEAQREVTRLTDDTFFAWAAPVGWPPPLFAE